MGGHRKVQARNKLPAVKSKEVYRWAHRRDREVTAAFKAIEAGLDGKGIPDNETLFRMARQHGVPTSLQFRPPMRSQGQMEDNKARLTNRPDLLVDLGNGFITGLADHELDGFPLPESDPELNRDPWRPWWIPIYAPPKRTTSTALGDWKKKCPGETLARWLTRVHIAEKIKSSGLDALMIRQAIREAIDSPGTVKTIPLEFFIRKVLRRAFEASWEQDWEAKGFAAGIETAKSIRDEDLFLLHHSGEYVLGFGRTIENLEDMGHCKIPECTMPHTRWQRFQEHHYAEGWLDGIEAHIKTLGDDWMVEQQALWDAAVDSPETDEDRESLDYDFLLRPSLQPEFTEALEE
jgi:hypothetical protein